MWHHTTGQLICREQDYKFFGHDKVFGCLIRDLNDLEENGLVMSDGQVYRGTLCAIAGDNLGSHNVGGFSENFSKSTHFCRFCDIDRETLTSSTMEKGTFRTAESYNDHVQQLVTLGLKSSAGIKFGSEFNDLSFFHICQPGLPPCLGHDLFAGVVSYDLALYISHFITQQKEFSYVE